MTELLNLLPFLFPIGFFAVFAFIMVRVLGTLFGGNSAMERMLKGTVTRELGLVETRKLGITTITTTAYELEKNGERVLVLRRDARAPMGASVQFHEYPPAVRSKLRAAIEAMDEGTPDAGPALLPGVIPG